jgi:hypothetical protein
MDGQNLLPAERAQGQQGELDIMTLGRVLAQSGYFADARDAAQAIVKVLAGRELGIGPIASMTGIYIVQGRPTLSASLMAALIKRSGRYDYRVERLDNTACVLRIYDRGTEIGVSSFTLQDAATAELTTGRNAHSWRHYPRNMLFARAISNAVRFFCPDLFVAPVYTPEELGAEVDETGDIVCPPPAPSAPASPASPAPSDEPSPVADEAHDDIAGDAGADADEIVRRLEGEIEMLHSREDYQKTISEPKAKALALFVESKVGKEIRHALIERVTGRRSTKELTEAEAFVLRNWLSSSDEWRIVASTLQQPIMV